LIVQRQPSGAVRALHFVNAGGGAAVRRGLLACVGAPPLTPALQLALTAPRRLPGNAAPMRGEVKGATDLDNIREINGHLGDFS
jgi:hypothetical protein